MNLDQLLYSALIVGLAREGTALARFLVEHKSHITITDIQSAEALGESLAQVADLPVELALGGHPLVLLDDIDIVFVSPGVPLEIPLLVEARRLGLPLSSETRLFTRLCPAQIVGITGSSGKTTTTALLGKIFEIAGRRTWVGGNIGRPLISHLHEIQPDDGVVMELSSFQLEMFAPWLTGKPESILFDPAGWSPPIAAVLNITPNHLDRHPSMEAYIQAKAEVLKNQHPGDISVLNLDDPITTQMASQLCQRQQVLWFSMEQEVEHGTFVRENELILQTDGFQQTICRLSELQLMGRHNVANTLAACALAHAAGIPVDAMRRAVTSFRGVEHRLELVRTRNGVRWYNDSIATTPERTVAALKSFEEPVILLAGGRDKHLPWDEMASLTWNRVRHLILFGEAADLIETAMINAHHNGHVAHDPGQPTQIHHAQTLENAIQMAAQLAQPGDVTLLSPGGTSFDTFHDFAERGERFRALVQALE